MSGMSSSETFNDLDDKNYIQKARAMDALDTCHLDVGGGGGPGDEGGWQMSRRDETIECFRHRTYYLIGEDHAEVIVGDQRKSARSLCLCVLQHKTAGERNPQRASADNAIEAVDFQW